MTNQLKNRKFLASTLTAAMVAAAVVPVAGAAATENGPFPDVPADHPYADVITDMAKAKIVQGGPSGNFDLGGNITRAEAAQMVAGLLSVNVGEEANATDFEDVKSNVWYTGAINSLVKAGVISGIDENTFAPSANITRGQLAQLLVTAYGLEDVNVDHVKLPFTDVEEDAWYAKPIKILHSEGLIKGQTETTFGPKADMKRGDFAWLAANIDYALGDKLPKPEVEEIKITSIDALNDTVLQAIDADAKYQADYKLALDYLDADGKVIPSSKLPDDLEVTFADSKEAFNTDGTIQDLTKLGTANDTIRVAATVSSKTEEVNLTKEFTLKVVAGADYNEVTEAILKVSAGANSGVEVETAVIDEKLELVPTQAILNNGQELDATNPNTVKWANQVASVSTSNEAVLAAEFLSNKVVLNPISPGQVTVTVTLNSGKKFTKIIHVKTAARKATTATATNLDVSSTEPTGKIDVVLTDQYGDPVKGQTIYGHPTKTGKNAVLTVARAVTNNEGKASLAVTATDSDTVKISTEADHTKAGFTTSTVTYFKAGAVTNYDLRIAANSESQDGILDLYNDDELNLQFIGKDANGILAKIYDGTDVGSTYQVTSSNTDIAKAAVNATDGTIRVTPHEIGTTTITIKEGNITRATYTVTVKSSAPNLNDLIITTHGDFSAKESSTYEITNERIAELVSFGDFELRYNRNQNYFDLLDGTKKLGYVEILSTKTEFLIVDPNGKTLETTAAFNSSDKKPSVVFRLRKMNGQISKSEPLQLTYDNIAPDAPIFTATPVTSTNKTNYELSGTAEAGSTVAVTFTHGTSEPTTSSTVTDETGNWVTDTIDLTEGNSLESGDTINISVTAKDAAGNVSKPKTHNVTYN